jgi:NAD(P)-dependent dehydrogenase (short-subunit alcohol dehydrogenase family)
MLFSRELAKRYKNKGLTSFSLHPGTIFTNLQRDVDPADFSVLIKDYAGNSIDTTNMALKSIPQGTSTHMVAAFDPNIISDSGSFLDDCQIVMDHARSYDKDDALAEKRW